MKKVDNILLKLFLVGAPLVMLVAAMASYLGPDNLRQNYQWLNDFSGFIFGIWFLAAFYFALRILISPLYRETVFSKLAHLIEQDEREERISAQALRSTYLTNLAILIFLLIFFVLNVSAYRVPESQAVNGKRGLITMGMNYTFWNSSQKSDITDEKEYIFNLSGLPLNGAGVVLLLIFWNLSSYRILVRKSMINR